MDLEKENGNIKWFKKNELRIRLKNKGEKSIVCVMLDGYNICFKLMLFDFVEQIKEELMLDISIIKIWNNQRAFIIDSNHVLELINYIPVFVNVWNIKISINALVFSPTKNKWENLFKQPPQNQHTSTHTQTHAKLIFVILTHLFT